MGIGGQITALLKHEYPSLIEESPTKKYYARKWSHYYITKDDDEMTAADRFKEEFWSIYSVADDKREHAEYVLEKFAAKQCKNMMYELRPATVKNYYRKILKRPISDTVARQKELREGQYLRVRPEWISLEAWQYICAYWCSAEYKKKRKLGQESRLQDDFTQNRGGSRSHSQTKQYLAKQYGPEAATDINTYCCMKSGLKNCDSTGKSGPIISDKAQKRVDDYFHTLEAEHPDDCEQRKSDGNMDVNVLYKSGHGLRHGRVPIANGAVRKSEIIAAARENSASTRTQGNSMSYQQLQRRNAQLEQGVQISLVLGKHMQALYDKLGMEVPAEIVAIQELQANICSGTSQQGTQSSHADRNEASDSRRQEDEDGNNIDP
ncbi:hypothetical protein EJB05_14250 [Eragrostis curvula]|uniref:Uncharacterized protein n=1 Tax=Eragrostis curvula TaxID=38414 RepID=A0A5J9VYJ8_9POAL|nr:hypothetical protein EJB05_14250 [Eragrostis curvula]